MTVTVGPISAWSAIIVLAWVVVLGLGWLFYVASGRRDSKT